MPDFGIFRGFNEKLFGDKLVAGQLPTQLGLIGSERFSFKGLLDFYPNAAAAYSLRLLLSTYTGSAIRVRRSNDNAEQDIGFVNNVLDTSSLTSFCGVNSGFVKTWYDQSGNAFDATQTTAANQPQIVSSGSVILDNQKPAISFSSDFLAISLISSATEASIISICNPNQIASYNTIFGNGSNNGYALTTDSTKYNLFYRGVSDLNTVNNANFSQSLIFAYTKSNTNQTLYSNNVLFQNITPPNMNTPTTSSRIGAYDNASRPFQGEQQELIIYTSSQLFNRTGISENINNFYSIY
jgi:hypothetical protein